MPLEKICFTEDPASELVIVLSIPNAQQAPAARAITFFTLPRELRDLIYSHLFEAVYVQPKWNAHLDTTQPGPVQKMAEIKKSDRLAILQASRRLWEEGSRILYGEHLFRFQVGSTAFNATFLTQETANMMQDIEISLGPSNAPNSVRILQIFGTSQTLRKSCFIKLQYRNLKLMHDNVLEALKQLTGFKMLTFELDAPVVVHCWQSGDHIPWVSGLLVYIRYKLTLALGPSMYVNGDGYRRLIFSPKDHRRQKNKKN